MEPHLRLTCGTSRRICARWHCWHWISFGNRVWAARLVASCWKLPRYVMHTSWSTTSNYILKNQVTVSPACVGAPLGSLPEGCFKVTSTSRHKCANIPNSTHSVKEEVHLNTPATCHAPNTRRAHPCARHCSTHSVYTIPMKPHSNLILQMRKRRLRETL